MRRLSFVSFVFSVLVCSFLILAGLGGMTQVVAQENFAQPPAGSIYREYAFVASGSDINVIDPYQESLVGANPILRMNIDDLQGAIRAEAIIDLWGGHLGTYGKAMQWNGNPWIPIPELYTPPSSPECYANHSIATVPIPLSHLVQGTNEFHGRTPGQTCYNINWGIWSWWGIIIRVYYDGNKPHSTGNITSPTAGSLFTDNPTISLATQGDVSRVDFLGYYNGIDTDGDGIYTQWHHDYHRINGEFIQIRNHIGTVYSANPSIQWNTTFIPDQNTGSVKLQARIQNSSGIWYVTPFVENLTFHHGAGSARLYTAYDVPQGFVIHFGNVLSSKVFISDDPSSATAAYLAVNTMNGINAACGDPPGSPGTTCQKYLRVNGVDLDMNFGANHEFSYDLVPIPTYALRQGANVIEWYANSPHHGIEVLWPGPSVYVLFDSPVPVQLTSFTALPVAGNNSVRLEWKTASEINSWGFEVQRANGQASGFATVPNSFQAGHNLTLEPQDYAFVDESPGQGPVFYRLKQIDLNGAITYSEAVRVDLLTSVTDLQATGFALLQNHPNPFNPSTTIRYSLLEAGPTSLVLMNILGETVQTLVDEVLPAGQHSVVVDAKSLPSGTYYYRLSSGSHVATMKMLLIR